MRRILAPVLLGLLLATTAGAQVTNGDFTAGLTGWTPSSTGPAAVQFAAFGWPADSANLRRIWTITGPTTGTASISQEFSCDGGGEGGHCDIRLDRYINTNGPVVTFRVWVDGVIVHEFAHGPLNRSDWVPVAVQVGCGEHTLDIAATATVTSSTDDWNVNLDNVVGVCEGSVATEDAAFGALKATYR